MIQPAINTCWVRGANGRSEPFDADRLAGSIRRGATLAGQADWWLAELLAVAIEAFIVGKRVTATELAALVAQLLAALGFTEIGEAYQRRRECAEIHLDQLNVGFELDFFRELDSALGDAAETKARFVRVRGLRASVMQLRSARRWCNRCRRLAEEIIKHVQSRVVQSDVTALRLAVVD